MPIDQTAWGNIPPRTPGHLDEARNRLTKVFADDPFVAMFSPEIRACIVNAFLLLLKTRSFYKVPDGLETHSHTAVTRDLKRAVKHMPLAFTTPDFQAHLVSLATFALIPRPERDDTDPWG